MDPTRIAEGLRSWVLGHVVIPGALLLRGNVSTLVVVPGPTRVGTDGLDNFISRFELRKLSQKLVHE